MNCLTSLYVACVGGTVRFRKSKRVTKTTGIIRKGAIKTNLVSKWIRLLETRAADAMMTRKSDTGDALLARDTTDAMQVDLNVYSAYGPII